MDFVLDFIISSERVPFALCGIILSLIVGVLLGAAFHYLNPYYWFVLDKLISPGAVKLNRANRTISDLILRGGLLTLAAMAISLAIGTFFTVLAEDLPIGGLIPVLALMPLLAGGALFRTMPRLHKGLKGEAKAGDGVYLTLSNSTRYNLATADNFTITRLGILFMARSFDKMLVGPVFWYFIGGLPLAYLYSTLAFMKWRTGKEGHSKGFGVFAEKLEYIFGIIPSYLSACLMLLASIFTPTASFTRALKGFLTSKKGQFCLYEQGGRPVSVIIWALNISLGGSFVDYEGVNIKSKWIGPPGSTARLKSGHLKRTVYILAVSQLIFIMLLLLFLQFDPSLAISEMPETLPGF